MKEAINITPFLKLVREDYQLDDVTELLDQLKTKFSSLLMLESTVESLPIHEGDRNLNFFLNELSDTFKQMKVK